MNKILTAIILFVLFGSVFVSKVNREGEPPERPEILQEYEFYIEPREVPRLEGCAIDTPGIVLTFDDLSVESWYKAHQDIFKEKRIKATFYLSNIDRVDEETQGKLLELQDYGHELAAHTMNHIHPNTKTEVQYMQEEIYNHIELSEKLGFDTQAFSYPLGEGTPRLDGLLLQEYNSLRYIGSIGQDRTFYKNRCTRILNAGSLDHRRGITKQDLYEVVERVYRDNSIVILYGHTILEEEPYSDYSISYELLEYLIETAQEKGISFFTVSEVFE